MKERDILFDPLKTEEDMIFESMERLRFAAKCEEEKLRLSNCEYTWEIGAEVIDKLYKNVVVNRTKNYTLFGQKVNVNYEDKTIIKLWRSIQP